MGASQVRNQIRCRWLSSGAPAPDSEHARARLRKPGPALKGKIKTVVITSQPVTVLAARHRKPSHDAQAATAARAQ
jgi:hypothetical protein